MPDQNQPQTPPSAGQPPITPPPPVSSLPTDQPSPNVPAAPVPETPTPTVPSNDIAMPSPAEETGSAAPPFDIPPIVTPEKPSGNNRKVVATILGLLVLVGGITAGVVLVRQQQILQEKAWVPEDEEQYPGGPQPGETSDEQPSTGTSGGTTGTGDGGGGDTGQQDALDWCMQNNIDLQYCAGGTIASNPCTDCRRENTAGECASVCNITYPGQGATPTPGPDGIGGQDALDWCMQNNIQLEYCGGGTVTTTAKCTGGHPTCQSGFNLTCVNGSWQCIEAPKEALDWCMQNNIPLENCAGGTVTTTNPCRTCMLQGGKTANECASECNITLNTPTGSGVPSGWTYGARSPDGANDACVGTCDPTKNYERGCTGSGEIGQFRDASGFLWAFRCTGPEGGGTPITTGTPGTPGGGGDDGPTPTLPPGMTAQCLNIKAFDTGWNQLSTTQLSALKAGDTVRFSVAASASSGSYDQARFIVNGTTRAAVTQKRPGTQEFYDEITISAGTTTFSINAQVHHTSVGWF